MTGSTIQILFAMIIYMAAVIVIGIVFAGRANKSSENYFLGGRLSRSVGDRDERGGFRHERMAAHGTARRRVLVRSRGRRVDGYRSRVRYIPQLAHRLEEAPPLLDTHEIRSHFRSSSPTVSARRRRPCLQSRRSSSSFSSRSTRRAALSPAESCSLHCSGCLMSR